MRFCPKWSSFMPPTQKSFSDSHCIRQFSFVFAFKKDFISLKIPEKDQELDGWRVAPFYTPKVSCFLHENFVVNLIIVFSVTEDHKAPG